MTVRFDRATFAAVLDSIRMARGLTRRTMAKEAGVAPSTVTRIAQGRSPDADTLAALCVWANLTANTFFIAASEATS
jgi:transcriptional regulator with XRE-family HTH domain